MLLFTCSSVVCLDKVSASSFSILRINLFTWYSCSFSSVCSSSTFSWRNYKTTRQILLFMSIYQADEKKINYKTSGVLEGRYIIKNIQHIFIILIFFSFMKHYPFCSILNIIAGYGPELSGFVSNRSGHIYNYTVCTESPQRTGSQ